MSNANFAPHENAPGPLRLHMEVADGSGKVNTDIQYIADRQAIVNTIIAYSYFFDEGRWEEFFALFSDDVVFEATTPEIGTVIWHGKKVFQEIFWRALRQDLDCGAPSHSGECPRRRANRHDCQFSQACVIRSLQNGTTDGTTADLS